jgi:capsular polysaccharide biosynthesis protein
MLYGNESLEETIVMFRRANVFVAAHGGGQANMIFMPEGGIVVEVRPELWPMPCYIDIADNLNIQHYLKVVKDVGSVGEMHIELSTFLPVLYSLIDNMTPTKS